jgi:4-amino-4-deoxy-L-arabinose transferase-like glycosyltransferase
MTTAERSLTPDGGLGGGDRSRIAAEDGGRASTRRWIWAGLALVLTGALGLRVWGIGQGLPYVYNADEADHFVVHAVGMFSEGTFNPHYFANPPAYTYLLHFLFALAYGGAAGVVHTFAAHPADVYTLARLAAAALGTVAVWLLYATGARLLGRGAGLLAAAIEAVAFLPVFYGHLALNDVPTLAPLTLSLLGSAGVLRTGRPREHLLAGVGLGLACATKYTAGIALLPLLAAIAARDLRQGTALGARRAGRSALRGLALAGGSAVGAFLIANPYAVLDHSAFHAELVHQSTLSADAQGKLGAPKDGGLSYYLWTLTWGLGWAPALAALGGAVSVWRRERALGWMLVPAPILYLAFMGAQSRYFGRWLLPIFPILCLLAALFALQLADALARRRPRLRAAGVAVIVAALLAQGLAYSVHSGKVLARADTRNLARDWMLAHIPAGAGIVAEPVEPEVWARARPGGGPSENPLRWRLYPALYRRVTATGAIAPAFIHPPVGLENYEMTLDPALIGFYEREGYCWVVTGSTESGRAYADPRMAPRAIAYYRALAREGEVVFRASPYAPGQGPVAFNFDWSFDYYPLSYRRPGPQMTVYRLHGGRCGG